MNYVTTVSDHMIIHLSAIFKVHTQFNFLSCHKIYLTPSFPTEILKLHFQSWVSPRIEIRSFQNHSSSKFFSSSSVPSRRPFPILPASIILTVAISLRFRNCSIRISPVPGPLPFYSSQDLVWSSRNTPPSSLLFISPLSPVTFAIQWSPRGASDVANKLLLNSARKY